MEINNYPNYLIYEDGRVFSKKNNMFMKISKINDNCRYNRVGLHKNNKQTPLSIHRLVAEHYIPNPENKPVIDHIDRNRLNNHKSNLRWVTIQENCLNRGTRKNQKHKWIYKRDKNFVFERKQNYKIYKRFKTLKESLCYKYIFLLKIKSNII
jgi:hypothetical protein